jgi:hypothetical protein
MFKETPEGVSVAIENDLRNPLVESGIPEHGVEFFLRDHTVLAHYVVHVDEQVEGLRPASEWLPKVNVAPEATPQDRCGRAGANRLIGY